MQNTRLRILNYLESHHQATAPELSLILDQTQANIRHHLNVLEKDGYIEIIGQVHSTGRGRPTNIYMLTKTAQDNALDNLASALLASLLERKNSTQRDNILKKIAKQLASTAAEPNKSITIQLNNAVQRLNELNYKSHWEAHASAPQIIFGRCPYAQIINQHPELCTMDHQMLQILTGADFIQVEKISRSQQGPSHCLFVLKQV
jgi:predicted ArsR family transcriptional regulator